MGALWALLVVFVAAGCSQKQESQLTRLPNGDLQETTSSIQVLPGFLDGQDERLSQIYAIAAHHHELLEWIPCYCGCGESAGHASNKHCFVSEVRKNGTVVWNDHGTRCGVCLDIAVQSATLYKQGMSAEEIRNTIDQAYGAAGLTPTDTPMPH